MFLLWSQRTFGVKLLAAGKWPRGCLQVSSRGHSWSKLSARPQEIVPALADSIRSKAAYMVGV